jgi:hypothetical protein
MLRYGAILFALVLGSVAAKAEITVSELLKDYASVKAERRALIETVVAENQNGLTWANSYLRLFAKRSHSSVTPTSLC